MRKYSMSHIYDYQVQMASIKKGDWRLQNLIDQGCSRIQLKHAEHKLWKRIRSIINAATPPASENPFFPNSKLLGYGWEWAAYLLPNGEVLKTPAGIFPEVNEPEYLKNTEHAYQLCKRYLSGFVVASKFERKKTQDGEINTITQRKLPKNELRSFHISTLNSALKRNLTKLGTRLLKMLENEDWLPDIELKRKGIIRENEWQFNNIVVENNKPNIFDFTSYYDLFRLYPQRTKREIHWKREAWTNFISQF